MTMTHFKNKRLLLVASLVATVTVRKPAVMRKTFLSGCPIEPR